MLENDGQAHARQDTASATASAVQRMTEQLDSLTCTVHSIVQVDRKRYKQCLAASQLEDQRRVCSGTAHRVLNSHQQMAVPSTTRMKLSHACTDNRVQLMRRASSIGNHLTCSWAQVPLS